MVPRTRNNLIALVCFAPISISLLPWGLLLLPNWISSLANQLEGNPKNVFYGPDGTIWVDIWPIASFLFGIAGIVGLFRFLGIVNFPDRPHRKKLLTWILVTCGVLGVVIFNVTGGGVNPLKYTTAAMVYWILPLGGTAYFLFLAQKEILKASDKRE